MIAHCEAPPRLWRVSVVGSDGQPQKWRKVYLSPGSGPHAAVRAVIESVSDRAIARMEGRTMHFFVIAPDAPKHPMNEKMTKVDTLEIHIRRLHPHDARP